MSLPKSKLTRVSPNSSSRPCSPKPTQDSLVTEAGSGESITERRGSRPSSMDNGTGAGVKSSRGRPTSQLSRADKSKPPDKARTRSRSCENKTVTKPKTPEETPPDVTKIPLEETINPIDQSKPEDIAQMVDTSVPVIEPVLQNTKSEPKPDIEKTVVDVNKSAPEAREPATKIPCKTIKSRLVTCRPGMQKNPSTSSARSDTKTGPVRPSSRDAPKRDPSPLPPTAEPTEKTTLNIKETVPEVKEACEESPISLPSNGSPDGGEKLPGLLEMDESEVDTAAAEAKSVVSKNTEVKQKATKVAGSPSSNVKRSQSTLSSRSSVVSNKSTTSTAKLSRIPTSAKTTLHRSLNIPALIPAAPPTNYLENQFILKKKKLSSYKKDLYDRQKVAFDMQDALSQLKQKIRETTGKEMDLEELRMVQCDDYDVRKTFAKKTSISSTTVCVRSSTMTQATPKLGAGEVVNSRMNILTKPVVMDTAFIENIQDCLKKIPSSYLEVCHSAIGKNRQFISWFNRTKESLQNCDQDIFKDLQLQEDNTTVLLDLLDEAEKEKESQTATIIASWRAAWSKKEALQQENDALLKQITDLTEKSKENSLKASPSAVEQNHRKLQTEALLKTTRQKLKDADHKLSEQESKINQLTTSVKTLEMQIKQKDLNNEYKLKEMQKKYSRQDHNYSTLEKQRTSLEQRVRELIDEKHSSDKMSQKTIDDLTVRVKEVTQKAEAEATQRERFETLLRETKKRADELEAKADQLKQMTVKTKQISGEETVHSPLEVELWTEHQALNVTMRAQLEELVELREEKARFVKMMDEHGQLCNTELTKELVAKEEKIASLKKTIEDLTFSLESSQDTIAKHQREIVHLENRLLCREAEPNFVPQTVDLQNELMSLQRTVEEWKTRYADLNKELTRKSMDLECKDRFMREQSNVLKVRDELISMLKDREVDNKKSIDKIRVEYEDKVELIQKEIVNKAEELQSLFSTLEVKQMQVARLEKVVKSMESQQLRSQAQRTRYEERIADLESQLAMCKSPTSARMITSEGRQISHQRLDSDLAQACQEFKEMYWDSLSKESADSCKLDREDSVTDEGNTEYEDDGSDASTIKVESMTNILELDTDPSSKIDISAHVFHSRPKFFKIYKEHQFKSQSGPGGGVYKKNRLMTKDEYRDFYNSRVHGIKSLGLENIRSDKVQALFCNSTYSDITSVPSTCSTILVTPIASGYSNPYWCDRSDGVEAKLQLRVRLQNDSNNDLVKHNLADLKHDTKSEMLLTWLNTSNSDLHTVQSLHPAPADSYNCDTLQTLTTNVCHVRSCNRELYEAHRRFIGYARMFKHSQKSAPHTNQSDIYDSTYSKSKRKGAHRYAQPSSSARTYCDETVNPDSCRRNATDLFADGFNRIHSNLENMKIEFADHSNITSRISSHTIPFAEIYPPAADFRIEEISNNSFSSSDCAQKGIFTKIHQHNKHSGSRTVNNSTGRNDASTDNNDVFREVLMARSLGRKRNNNIKVRKYSVYK